ncbi:MAG: hypothetical protein IKR71_09455 [Bacteroidales bacterium]|nr:hypothetical protein [Bacteroidales bacterium]
MKRLLFLSMMCLMALSMQAQRCAVLEFKAGVGISQNDVDGISAIFITYFRPAGYTMVERTQIDKAIEEQGFQRSQMTQAQMVRVGQILNVSKIVVGDINVVMGQYNVDARVINVETGTISATEGATFATSSYRASMQSVATKLAAKIAITPGQTVQAKPATQAASTPRTRSSVEVLYGYLKIFPNEIGEFQSEPKTVIAQINKQAMHDYNSWRLPTNEELSLLRANNYLGNGKYMTRESKTGIVLLVTDKDKGDTLSILTVPDGYVDLGLSSGTFWKDMNEYGFFTYDEAVSRFGSSLPSKEKFEELKSECKWEWNGSGCKVTGPNGNSIVLPASGYRHCDGGVDYVGSSGYYWSSSPKDSDYAWSLYFDSGGVGVFNYSRCGGRSVRLVQD